LPTDPAEDVMATDPDSADLRVHTVCLLILTVIAVGAALSLLQAVLVPFFLALFLTYCLTPVIDFEANHLRLPPPAALVGAGLLGLVVLLLFGFLAATAIARLADSLQTYGDRFHQLEHELARSLPLHKLGIHPDAETGQLFTIQEEAVRHLLSSFLRALVDVVSTGALVLVFLLFILLGRQQGIRAPTSILGEVELRVRRYLLQLVGFSALAGVLVGLTLAALGVEFAYVFGFLTFLLNFIPNIGSIIATLLPLPVVVLSPDLAPAARVLAIVLPGVIQGAIGVVQPRVMGSGLDLHPVVVLMALIFFGMIWGIIGAFLALPITGVIKIVLERIPATRPLAAALSGDLAALSAPQEEPAAGSVGDSSPKAF
jgi:AI-2 transport protein TqsA